MKPYDQFKKAVHDGELGINKGIPLGLPKLTKLLGGIQKKRLDLVFASEGVGKSAFVANSYVLNPYEWYIKRGHKKVDLQILWFALEIDLVSILSKSFCWKMYKETSILVSPNIVLGRGDSKIPSLAKDKVYEYEEYFEKMIKRVHIIDSPMTPTMIKKYIEKFAESRGYYKKDSNGIVRYIPYNPDEHIIVIVDTLGNLKRENVNGAFDKKSTIDFHSELSRDIYRNQLGYTICNVAHSNRSISNIDRARFGEIFPHKDDIKESSQPSADADTVIALFNPLDYMNSNNNLNKFMGYDIDNLKDRFRALGVLKHRHGSANKRVGMLYVGEIGLYQELPQPHEITPEQYEFIKKIQAYEGI